MARTLPRHTPVVWLSLVALLFIPGTVALTRGPYLQSVTTTSAIVVWRTDVAGSSRVDYGMGDYTYSIEQAGLTTEHVITLTALLTNTEVMYRISTDGVELASSSFRTPPSPDQPVTFAVMGDSGTGSTGQYAVANRMVALDPQLVLHTGDVIYPDGQASGYDPFFFEPYKALARRAPIYLTLGDRKSVV